MAKRRKVAAMDITKDRRWSQLVSRDRSADGTFFYSVATTGVYCRPSCGARTPLPKNVAFHRTTAEAERAGFRACKRCKPNAPSLAQEHASVIAELCRFIDASEATPTLAALSSRSGLSPFHLHRVFKEVTGLTPRAYAAAARAKKMRASLDRSASVTEAVYDAGYSSSSRFYETSDARLGMTPKRWRSGGVHTTIRFAVGECSLGSILVAASERGICAVTLGDDPDALARDLQDRFPRANLTPGDRAFERTIAAVIAFVDAPRRGFHLPLDVRGTAFQERVWKALRAIPAGETSTYTEIAARIGAPAAVRGVASACAANPVAVVIPCHRVISKDGKLSGYRWGIERKRALLDAEAQAEPH
jgi:AraC family transcriptional regulator of adaptative response/methylated-DNA-[protein]-cysteine methyltransferase